MQGVHGGASASSDAIVGDESQGERQARVGVTGGTPQGVSEGRQLGDFKDVSTESTVEFLTQEYPVTGGVAASPSQGTPQGASDLWEPRKGRSTSGDHCPQPPSVLPERGGVTCFHGFLIVVPSAPVRTIPVGFGVCLALPLTDARGIHCFGLRVMPPPPPPHKLLQHGAKYWATFTAGEPAALLRLRFLSPPHNAETQASLDGV